MDIRFLLSVSLFFCVFSLGFAAEEKERNCLFQKCERMIDANQLSEKMHVNPEDVFVTEDGIFILDESGEVIPVHSLHHDEQGLYAQPLELAFTCIYGHEIICPCGGCSS